MLGSVRGGGKWEGVGGSRRGGGEVGGGGEKWEGVGEGQNSWVLPHFPA